MNALDRILPRSAVKLNILSRWSWGAEPTRVVRVVLLERPEGLVAQVVDHDGAGFVLLDEQPATGTEGRHVLLADGTSWALASGGCGCGSPLKRYDPLRSEARR